MRVLDYRIKTLDGNSKMRIQSPKRMSMINIVSDAHNFDGNMQSISASRLCSSESHNRSYCVSSEVQVMYIIYENDYIQWLLIYC